METRFGVKDFILFVLLAGVIIVQVVSMYQYDRQYEQIQDIKKQNRDLANDVAHIQRRLAAGVALGNATGAEGSTPATELEFFAPVVSAEKKPDFARGDWLVDNFGTKIGRLTPLISTDLYQQWVEVRVMQGLVTRNINTLKFEPVLANSWTISPDGLTIDFKLRTDVLFSDGEPFTADDVVFTFNWIQNKDVNAPRYRAYLEKLKSVTARGPYEVEFKFTEPYFQSMETVGTQSILSRHFYSRFTPQQFNERTGLLIGTGPYKLEDPENWSPGKPVVLMRNERYWGVPGTFDRLVYKEVEDEAAEMVMFGNGDLDVMACQPKQYNRFLNDKRILAMSQHLEYPSPLNGYIYIGWNQSRKTGDKRTPTVFADRRVRQAMTMLLDRERICKEVFEGYATVADGPFDPNGPQSDPTVKPFPHDEARAKELLAAAGFADRNGDGTIEGPDGQALRFKLSYPSGSATFEQVVLFIKDSYARAGITMEPEPLDWPVLLDKVERSDFDASALGWGGTVESDAYQIFDSSQIKDRGDNRTYYINHKLDQVIEEARRTIDDEKRMQLWHEVHRIIHEDQPYTFLINRPSLVFLNGRIKNVERSKLGLNFVRLYPNPIPWYVPKVQQKYTH